MSPPWWSTAPGGAAAVLNDADRLPLEQGAVGHTVSIGLLKSTFKTYFDGIYTSGTTLLLGETSATAYRGDRGKTAYDHSQAAHNYAPALGLDDNYVTDAEKTVIGNTSGTNSGNETTATIGALIYGAVEEANPASTELFAIRDNATGLLRSVSWGTIKTALALLFQPTSQVTAKGTLTAASSAADRTFNATTASDYTATIGAETVTAILEGFTGVRQSITILLTTTGTGTLALSGGTWTVWTTQTLTTMAAGTYLVVFKSVDSGTTGLVTVQKKP